MIGGNDPNRQNLNFNFSYPLFNNLVREQQSVQADGAAQRRGAGA